VVGAQRLLRDGQRTFVVRNGTVQLTFAR